MSMSTRRRSTRANRRPPIRNIKESNPIGADPLLEYRYIRRDLVRILAIGGGLLAIMIVLAVLNVF
ncbi:MAG: hypothetical protein H0T53_09190 [Herpetosiphonaceae bacterium]|nr:hypothetical protein [Herpetosiphonaceae bacterium]